MSKNENQACSFCNQTGPHAHPMFSGPGMNIRICGKCVTFAQRVLLDHPSEEKHGDCSFCGRTQDQTGKLIFGPGVNICLLCVTFASQRLDGGDSANAKTTWSLWHKRLTRIRSLILGDRAKCVDSVGV